MPFGFSDIENVLRRIGVDPSTRVGSGDQDAEYTSCRIAELSEYIRLYERVDTPESEKHVLCCFMLECLNEVVQSGATHPLEDRILHALFDNRRIHEEELSYWMDTSDPNSDNWWPITHVLLKYDRRL
ncbi:MAG: hypothetical protein DWQ29_07740 [Planctomycetota bacterium]|nr:MAG: hypothetical protein DWQ29_07740 [Planctomycetota bacterium]